MTDEILKPDRKRITVCVPATPATKNKKLFDLASLSLIPIKKPIVTIKFGCPSPPGRKQVDEGPIEVPDRDQHTCDK